MIKNINLDDQQFDNIVDGARKAIRKYAPFWTDENTHDPGITMIELFAWLKEMLQYYMDQTTEPLEYLFLKLYGINKDFGKPAALIACVDGEDEISILPNSSFKKGRYVFENEKFIKIDPVKIIDLATEIEGLKKSVYMLMDNGLTIQPFGQKPTCGNIFDMTLNKPLLTGYVYNFYFSIYSEYEIERNPISENDEFISLSTLKWKYKASNGNWEDVRVYRDETFGFLKSGRISFGIEEDMGAEFIIRAVLHYSDYDVPPKIENIYTNVMELIQIESIPSIEIANSDIPFQAIKLPYDNIFYEDLRVSVFDNELKSWKAWSYVDSIYEAGSDSHVYTVDIEGSSVLFGNNKNGLIPNGSIRIENIKRSFLGGGNINIDALYSEFLDSDIKCLTQAYGGKDIQTLEQLKSRLYYQINNTEVAVTSSDYEDILLKTPGLMIQKVKCLPMYRPGLQEYPDKTVPNEVSVFVIPYGISKLNDAYLKNLRKEIDKNRLITTEVHILDPVYFNISLYIELKTKLDKKDAFKRIKELLKPLEKLDFGQTVAKGIFYQKLIGLKEIDYISEIKLTSQQPLAKNKIGDLLIPPNGIAIIDEIEFKWIED